MDRIKHEWNGWTYTVSSKTISVKSPGGSERVLEFRDIIFTTAVQSGDGRLIVWTGSHGQGNMIRTYRFIEPPFQLVHETHDPLLGDEKSRIVAHERSFSVRTGGVVISSDRRRRPDQSTNPRSGMQTQELRR